MTSPRDTWTNARIDDLSKMVDTGFARVDADIRELRGEIKWLIYGLVPIGASSVGTFIHEMNCWLPSSSSSPH